MKRFLTLFAALLVGMVLLVADADAKRLGGGMNSGMSRNTTALQRPTSPAATPAPTRQTAPTATPQPTPAPQPAGNRWLGPLAGLAAGVGIGALLGGAFGGGMGGGFLSTLLMVILAFFAVRFVLSLFRKNAPQPVEYAPATPAPTYYEPAPRDVPMIGGGLAAAQAAPQGGSIPADFDVEGFLRQAKLNFIRLQAANDAGNMDDIRAVTTPEMYAEIKMELTERGGKEQQTDVVNLNADLLDVTTEEKRHIASVRYFGTIREEKNGPAESFDEVWHLVKPVDGSHGWVIAGIQQMH